MAHSDSTVDREELFPVPRPQDGTVLVNERVSFRTIGGYRVVSVDSVVLHHYPLDDRMAEVYAMITLVDTGSDLLTWHDHDFRHARYPKHPRSALRANIGNVPYVAQGKTSENSCKPRLLCSAIRAYLKAPCQEV